MFRAGVLPEQEIDAAQGVVFAGLFQFDQQILCVDLAAGGDVHRLYNSVTFCVQPGFHFHGFDGQKQIPFADLLAGLHPNRGHDRAEGKDKLQY